MTDPITAMYIYGVDMFLCGRSVFYHFHDCIERSCYISSERINSILCLPVTEGGWVGRGITPVIACDDKTIKVLENGKLIYEVYLNDVPLTLHLFMNDGGYNKQKVLYGTKSGRLGLVDLQTDGGIVCWEISTKSSGGITVIYCHKITNTGVSDVLLGKDDGLVEIYSVDDNDEVQFRQVYQCDESITGLDCGRINNEKIDEIIVCTYTGWVFALTTEPLPENIEATNSQQMEIKVQQLKSELEELELKVREERERYEETTNGNPESLTTVPPFSINDRFVLDKETSCYLLAIELVIPIEYIVLQCDADVELMDIARSTAVVSFTKPPQDGSGNKLLATYRCQADTTRIEMRIRSIEGRGGTLRAYIVPDIRPKMCQDEFCRSSDAYIADVISAAFGHGGQFFQSNESEEQTGITINCAENDVVIVSEWEWEKCIFSQFNFKNRLRSEFARPFCIASFCEKFLKI
uniref:Uncharacterized protein n=1 Tax=Panagrolaimus sp. ES5 TaxID=591445 RepID=A0AC34GRH9_9BILA